MQSTTIIASRILSTRLPAIRRSTKPLLARRLDSSVEPRHELLADLALHAVVDGLHERLEGLDVLDLVDLDAGLPHDVEVDLLALDLELAVDLAGVPHRVVHRLLEVRRQPLVLL